MRALIAALAAAALGVAAIPAEVARADGHGSGIAKVYESDDSFEDTRDALVDVIIDRGLVITYHAYVSNMLERTSEAVGASGSRLDNGEGLFFCQAGLTHELLEESKHNIVLCPYVVYVYEEDSEVYLSYRRSGGKAGSGGAKLDAYLDGLVREALE